MDNRIALDVKDLRLRYKCLNMFSIRQSFFTFKKANEIVFEALRGVSFSVPKGEILGIVGKNGSGKSTLLRAVAGIFSADEGTIDLHGNTVSLLSIGVGFQRELTGRENIVLSGMLLGFSEEEVRSKMNDIIEFAGLGEFIDMPVRTYSSGMHSKLAFAITAILEADIMLIDHLQFLRFHRIRQILCDIGPHIINKSHQRKFSHYNHFLLYNLLVLTGCFLFPGDSPVPIRGAGLRYSLPH